MEGLWFILRVTQERSRNERFSFNELSRYISNDIVLIGNLHYYTRFVMLRRPFDGKNGNFEKGLKITITRINLFQRKIILYKRTALRKYCLGSNFLGCVFLFFPFLFRFFGDFNKTIFFCINFLLIQFPLVFVKFFFSFTFLFSPLY